MTVRAVVVAVLVTAACSKPAPQHPTPPRPQPVDTAQESSRVELAPVAPCSTSCEAKLIVHALREFKVNADYPTKFVVGEGSVPVETSKLEIVDKTGTLTLRFQAAPSGETKVAGIFKYSVCSDDVCDIEQPAISFVVPRAP